MTDLGDGGGLGREWGGGKVGEKVDGWGWTENDMRDGKRAWDEQAKNEHEILCG